MKRIRFFFILGCSILVVFILACNFIINTNASPYIYTKSEGAPHAEAAVIPGAAIFPNGALSFVFKERADTAIRLYKAGKVSKILVSGDNSTVIHNEVNPVRNYLLENGVPDQDIFLDHAGFDTYSTMYRARDIFGVASILIATQAFHLPRSIFIARTLHITAYRVPADAHPSRLRNYIREMFANEKAIFDLVLHRKPKYLGEKIPISGDGRNSP